MVRWLDAGWDVNRFMMARGDGQDAFEGVFVTKYSECTAEDKERLSGASECPFGPFHLGTQNKHQRKDQLIDIFFFFIYLFIFYLPSSSFHRNDQLLYVIFQFSYRFPINRLIFIILDTERKRVT